MSREKVAATGVTREKDFMYYVKEGAVWKVPRKRPNVPKGRAEKVIDADIDMDTAFIYFVNKDGDVYRAPRAVGGQKRKKKARAVKRVTKKKAAKKTAKKKVGKKAAKKGGGKKKAGKKKGKR